MRRDHSLLESFLNSVLRLFLARVIQKCMLSSNAESATNSERILFLYREMEEGKSNTIFTYCILRTYSSLGMSLMPKSRVSIFKSKKCKKSVRNKIIGRLYNAMMLFSLLLIFITSGDLKSELLGRGDLSSLQSSLSQNSDPLFLQTLYQLHSGQPS